MTQRPARSPAAAQMARILRVPVEVDDWDRDRRRYFAQPYPLREALGWLRRNALGPHGFERPPTTHPLPRTCTLNPVTPALTLGFVGDILPLRATELSATDGLRAFFHDADLLVGNFEGTLTGDGADSVFMAQSHTPAVLDLLAAIFPPQRTVLCCANNHAGDYGWTEYRRSCERIAERGFLTIGRADEPAVRIHNRVLIAAGTTWSNQPCPYVARLSRIRDLAADAAFRILFPHWGYELEARPRGEQRKEARALLRSWDMIVGHHSHWPQPVRTYRVGGLRRVVAYSLGDFTFGLNLRWYLRGLVLKATLGPGPGGRWAVGRLEWRPTTVRFRERRLATLELDP